MFATIGCKTWRKTPVITAPPPVADNDSDATYVGPGQGPVVTFDLAPPVSATGDSGVTYSPPVPAGGTVAPAPAPAPMPVATGESIHVVKRGDTLWSIAQRYYGRGARWREIAGANGITDSKKLPIGLQLTIP